MGSPEWPVHICAESDSVPPPLDGYGCSPRQIDDEMDEEGTISGAVCRSAGWLVTWWSQQCDSSENLEGLLVLEWIGDLKTTYSRMDWTGQGNQKLRRRSCCCVFIALCAQTVISIRWAEEKPHSNKWRQPLEVDGTYMIKAADSGEW